MRSNVLQMLPCLIHPREVVIKRGSLVRMKYLEASRVVLITGNRSQKESGNLAKLLAYLESGNTKVQNIEGVAGECTIEMACSVYNDIRALETDWIIAFGGGTVIDCAKLVSAMYEGMQLQGSSIPKPADLPVTRKRAKLAAIPTTCGTGSEATSVSVLYDPQAQRKFPLVSPGFTPDLVVLDATVCLSLPKSETVASGVDAFCHALESYCSTLSNLFCDALSVAAGRLIKDALPTVLLDSSSVEAREQMQYAAFLAGVAQNLTSVGAIHALAHALGGLSPGFSHGLATLCFLKEVVRFNALTSRKPLSFVNAVGFQNLEELMTWVDKLKALSDVPSSWRTLLNNTKSLSVSTIVESASADVCLRTNPVRATQDDLRRIVESCL